MRVKLMENPFQKFINLAYRIKTKYTYRTLHTINNKEPLISFSFDDFPVSAAFAGAEILKKYNVKGTYYVSLGMLGQESPGGKICDLDAVKNLIEENHEIGSHTYNHANAYQDSIEAYEKSIITNEHRYKNSLQVSDGFQSFSYPFGSVSSGAKRITKKYFRCSRTSYHGINSGRIDLNMLKAYPIYSNSENIEFIKSVIDHNNKKRGWLIFYTHDVRENPSSFGCTPEYLEKVVKYSLNSGAKLVTIKDACDII